MSANFSTEILPMLFAAYPSFKPVDAAATIALWSRKLSGYERVDLLAAADALIETSKFFPSISEFLEAALHARDARLAAERQGARMRVASTAELRAEQLDLEYLALTGGYEPAAWEALAVRWTEAGKTMAAGACSRVQALNERHLL